MTERIINFPQKFLSRQVPLCLHSPITRLPFPNSPDDSVPNLIYGLRCGVRCRPNLSISITRDALTRLAALERNCPLRFQETWHGKVVKYRPKTGRKFSEINEDENMGI